MSDEADRALEDSRRMIREGLQAAVERMYGSFDGIVAHDGIVTTWVAVVEVSKPGGGFHWFVAGDASDEIAFLARTEGLLAYGMRRVNQQWEEGG